MPLSGAGETAPQRMLGWAVGSPEPGQRIPGEEVRHLCLLNYASYKCDGEFEGKFLNACVWYHTGSLFRVDNVPTRSGYILRDEDTRGDTR